MTKRKSDRIPTMGSISHGTLRPEDLISAFADELRRVMKRNGRHTELLKDADRAIRALDRGGWASNSYGAKEGIDLDDFASDVVNELQDALSEYASPYLYFGTHEGDGADFGWWPDMHNIRELPRYDDTGAAADDKFCGDFITVSDHGNIEIYCRFANGKIRNYFGIV